MPHDLIPASALPPGTLTDVEIADAIGFAGAEKAQATRAAYAVDWRQFSLWCHARAAQPLPAHPGILAGYLSHLARTGRKASSIGRAVAAIADHHRQAGYEPPTKHEGVRAVMKGIRRTLGTAPERKAAATAEHVRGMLACCPDSLIGLRDRALLALGFAGAFRRSELAALEVSDLAEVPDGYRVTIRRSKTDQTGEGRARGRGLPARRGRGAAREALRREDGTRSGTVRGSQPARRVRDERGRGRGVDPENPGGQPSPLG
jgi:integrase